MVKNGQILIGTLAEILQKAPELEHRHVRVIVDDAALGDFPTGEALEQALDELAGPVSGSIPEAFGREQIYGDHD